MLYECWLQFRGLAGARQLDDPRTALTHNLGGRPGSCVSFVSVVGRERGLTSLHFLIDSRFNKAEAV